MAQGDVLGTADGVGAARYRVPVLSATLRFGALRLAGGAPDPEKLGDAAEHVSGPPAAALGVQNRRNSHRPP